MPLLKVDREKVRQLRMLSAEQYQRSEDALEAHRAADSRPSANHQVDRDWWLRRNRALMGGSLPTKEARLILYQMDRLLAVPVADGLLSAWRESRDGTAAQTDALRRACNHPYTIWEAVDDGERGMFVIPKILRGRIACVLCGYDEAFGTECGKEEPDLVIGDEVGRWGRQAHFDGIIHVAHEREPLPAMTFDERLAQFLRVTDFDELFDAYAGRLACERVPQYLRDGLPPEIDYETAGNEPVAE